jgi:hypothetical protein
MPLMDPPDDPPPKPPAPEKKMRGKILGKGSCIHCDGEFILLQHEGETRTRLMHNQPWCEQFRKDPVAYWRQHQAFTKKTPKKKKR